MLGCLERAGHSEASTPEEADILIYNTCAVKGPTEDRMISLLKAAPKDKKVLVAGCLPLINFERLRREVDFNGVVGPAASTEIVEAVNRILRGEKPIILNFNSKPEVNLPFKPSNPVRRIIPVAYGCLSSCSYCCVRIARGRLRSYTIEEVKGQVERAVRAGVREIWLTGQDLACYGLDQGLSLAQLLREVVEVEGCFYVRVGMMNPRFLLSQAEEVAEAFQHPKIFKFLHLPVQSGDDEVLRLMNRGYTSGDFKAIVNVFRRKVPDLTLATDIICGFPGETEEAFQNTLRLLEEVKPDIVNVSKFYPRPGTPARLMEKLPTKLVKERSRTLTALAGKIALERNRRWLGWEGEILIDEHGLHGTMVGRNYAYKPIVVNEKLKLGETVRVKISKSFQNYLEGEIS